MTEPALLRVRDLSVAYAGVPVVDSLSLEVAPGRCLGVIGESGAGKSQAFLALLGLAARNARISGQASLGDEDLLTGARRLRGRRVAMIFQDPLSSLTPHLRIGDQITESLRVHRGVDGATARARAAQLLEQVRMNDVPRRLRQYPHELSGGMRQRAMIAMALACDPELLIADEPTTALDVSVQAQLLALLRQLVQERGMALVVVTHDMGVIAALADEVVVMRSGRAVERGEVTQILTAPAHEYTRALVAAVPRMDDMAVPRMDDTAVPRMDQAAESGMHAAAESRTRAMQPLLDARGLTVHHRLRGPLWRRAPMLTAVDGVSLRVVAGEALGIVGESGCGKSSLARALLRLHEVSHGEIVWLGKPIQGLHGNDLREVRSGLQMVFQDPVASLDPLQSVAEIVAEPLRALRPGLGAAERAARVRAVLDSVGLGQEYLDRRSHALSGGQCQRVAIARAMVLQPKLLVCDEAVSSLDVSIQAQIIELLRDIKLRHGTGIVFVSHNLAVVRRLCERVLVMYLGRVVETGPTETVFRRPHHPYTQLLLESVPLLDPARERARHRDTAWESGSAETRSVGRPPGCAFHPRCAAALSTCATASPEPEKVTHDHEVACPRWRDIVKSV